MRCINKDPNAQFIARQFGFEGSVHEIFAKDVLLSERMFNEIGVIAGEIAKKTDSFPTPELFTALLGNLNERFYLHSDSDELVLMIELGEQIHYVLIPEGFWTWSEEVRPEPAGMIC